MNCESSSASLNSYINKACNTNAALFIRFYAHTFTHTQSYSSTSHISVNVHACIMSRSSHGHKMLDNKWSNYHSSHAEIYKHTLELTCCFFNKDLNLYITQTL